MTLDFTQFWNLVFTNPVIGFIFLLNLAVILVNGWTDAPNAIATCVSTRALSPGKSIFMAAVCNFAGVTLMTLVNSGVAFTIYNMVDFSGDSHKATIALAAAMVAIVFWAVLTWLFGIPTSESHALIAGISGAAIALQGGFAGINGGVGLDIGDGDAVGIDLPVQGADIAHRLGVAQLAAKGIANGDGHLSHVEAGGAAHLRYMEAGFFNLYHG